MKTNSLPISHLRPLPKAVNRCCLTVLVGAILTGVISLAYGETGPVPDAINYQGKLTNERGEPVASGNYQVTFKIWKDLNSKLAADLVWSRSLPVHVVTNGMFNVLLSGAGPGSILAAFDGPDRFLGLTIVATPAGNITEPEISPRQRLVSAPFAIHAQNANKAEWATSATNAGYASSAETSSYANNSGRFANLDTNAFLTANKAAQTLNGKLTITNGSLTVHANVTAGGNVTAGLLIGPGTIPIGGIIMWSGTKDTIPDGWALCDGSTANTHVTPNLQNRFIVGAGQQYGVGAIGGNDSVTLTIAQIPAHTHTYTVRANAEKGGGTLDNHWNSTTSASTSATGGGQSHENRPPYYALCYIMRVR